MTPAEVQDFVLAFNKAVIERAMGAEINLHLGYPPGQPKQFGQVDERNGASGKTVITDRVPVRVEVPRDRDGSFEPILIPKHDRGGLDAAKSSLMLKPNAAKIPNVCVHIGISCIDLEEFKYQQD
ncbi:hypothetical protein WL94_24300 [Burkholderia cepacia]|nr:hypothetical protein WL94_24300 [Burkholderia cepacia]